MLNLIRRGTRGFQPAEAGPGWAPDPDVVWIDLLNPTREEEVAVEAFLGVDLPTLREMEALEPSSRLYQEGGATFLTASVIARSREDSPTVTPATFVLAGGRLVTLRYSELRAFTVFAERAHSSNIDNGAAVLLGLLDAIVERLAELIDMESDRVEAASQSIFHRPQGGDFRPLLTTLAHAQSLTSLIRTALFSLGRLIGFADLAPEISAEDENRAHIKALLRDVQSLEEHAGHQSSHIAFLLNAALGLINIEQNGIIKFFSVVAVIFLPPTLVASAYGMNFHHMPELDWRLGYPMAVAMMVASAVLPLLWFKRKGWL